MHLTPREIDKLLLHNAGCVAQKRLARGLRLNYPEPVAYEIEAGELELNAGRTAITLNVTNLGDRPVQVGSHYHFIETNAQLRFDRIKAYGKRLDIPAGMAVRFEP